MNYYSNFLKKAKSSKFDDSTIRQVKNLITEKFGVECERVWTLMDELEQHGSWIHRTKGLLM